MAKDTKMIFDYNLDIISAQKCYIFNALLRKGSVAAASRYLNLPGSKIQNDIKALEKALATPLMLRNQHKLVLTDHGTRFADFCRFIVDGMHHLETPKNPPPEDLVIASYYGTCEMILPDVIARFTKMHPHVSLQIYAGVEYIDFTANDLDIAIAEPIQGRSDLTHTQLLATPHYLYASPLYIEKFGLPKNFAEIRHHRVLLFKRTKYEPKQLFELIDPYIEGTSLGMLYELAIRGIGLAPLPKIRLKPNDLADKLLVEVFEGLECFHGNVSFITRRFSRKAALIHDFLEILKDVISKKVPN